MFNSKDIQRGSVTVFFALSLPVLLGVTAFAVDLGNGFYQKHRLQNIADSAALAGSKTLDSKVTLLPEDTKFSPSDIDPNETKLEKALTTSEKMLPDTNETDETLKAKIDKAVIYTKDDASGREVKYYEVQLSKKVPTYFAGIFGTDHFDIKVASVAKAEPNPGPVTEEEKEELIKQINANIHKTIPDYYSESIERINNPNQTDRFNPEYHQRALRRTEFTTVDDYWSSEYYTMVGNKYLYNASSDFSKNVAAYRDSNRDTDPAEDKADHFAQPFCELTTEKLMFSRCTFNDIYEKKTINYSNIKAAFLDVPNMGSSKYRGLVFNIENNADQKLGDKKEPFYIRVESEPIRVLQDWKDGRQLTREEMASTLKNNTAGRTLVAPKIINVNESTRRPIVIAYDGPDQNRNEDDAPILDEYNPITKKTQKTRTAVTSTAPFIINLNKEFKGVLYAPRSHVHIYGTAKINGFILARKITIHDQIPGRTLTETEQEVDIPVWVLDRETYSDGVDKGFHNNQFLWAAVTAGKYRRETLTSKFMIAYDDFYNYTIEEVEAD